MPVAYRRDLERSLRAFVETRRGLRLGRLFGAPAAFAGRRMFACVVDDGIAYRLPDEAIRRERVRGARPFVPSAGPAARRGTAMRGWLFYRPGRSGFDRATTRVLEEAASYAASMAVGP